MKVFYRGFNLYGQFPARALLHENFIDYFLEDLENVEVAHSFAVFLVAGRLLCYHNYERRELTSLNNLKKPIKQFYCIDDKIILLTTTGELYKINVDHLDEITKVSTVEMEDDFFKKITCGAKICVALTNLGHIYNIPNKLQFNKNDIIDIKTGREHCLILDGVGKVYSFGCGSRGQLGHGTLDDEIEPKLVEALDGIKIEKISAGGWHSCAVSQEGDLYTWGWNKCGQLGRRKEVSGVWATPEVVDLEANVKEVACGSGHTIVLLDNDELWGCGWNKYKQLTGNEEEYISEMTRLHSFYKINVIAIKCGPWSSLVLCN